MYYAATLYNIPWMLLYFNDAKPIYGKLIYEDSLLYHMLNDRDDVRLTPFNNTEYYQVEKTGDWLNLNYCVILHERKVKNDEVREQIQLTLFAPDDNNLPVAEVGEILEINEHCFADWMQSEEAQNCRNNKLLQIAEQLMPDLP